MEHAYRIGSAYYCQDCVDMRGDLVQANAVPVSGGELVYSVPLRGLPGRRVFTTHYRKCGRCDTPLYTPSDGFGTLEHFREGTMRYLPDSNEGGRRG